MRTICIMLVVQASVTAACGQGMVNFANTGTFATAADRSVYVDQIGGAKLTGTNYVAALYFGATQDAINQLAVKSEDDQSLLSSVAYFRDVDPYSSAAGTWAGGIRVLLGTTVGQPLFMQIRIWDITKFATFEDAAGLRAQSEKFSYVVPSPNDAAGLKINNFRGMVVPEPGTILLSAAGVGLLLLLRRRTRSESCRRRTVAWLFILGAGLASANAQGTVDFRNTGTFNTTADRSVYANGTKLVGTNYVAALYFGTTADNLNQFAILSEADPSLASAVGHFRNVDPSTAAAGTWSGGVRVLPGTTVGQNLFLQVRIWNMSVFATFDEARAGQGEGGQSDVFSYLVPSPGDSAGMKLNGLRAFIVYVDVDVPEPSTLGLCVVGAGLLFALRRWRCGWRR